MGKNRLHYVWKFDSGWIKNNNFNVNLTFEEAMRNQMTCSISSNTVIRTINRIVGREVTKENLEFLFNQKDKISKQANNRENRNKLNYIKRHIVECMQVPELAIITMEKDKDYLKMCKKFIINGKEYVRLSCSAGNARAKKVIFCEKSIAAKVIEIIDNGRNKNVPFIPSKYNAYRGLSTSGTKVVTFPRIAVIPDSTRLDNVNVWWVDENPDKTQDDTITNEVKEIEFNNFDGQGLVSPTMAMQWQQDLDIDYLPSEFIVRSAFLKGMCCVFDFVEWCREYNDDKYMINTIYADDNGEIIQVDVRDIDVILTESQFKLHNCYKSMEEYMDQIKKNKLDFGIALTNAKEDKEILPLNYQFIQTLNLDKQGVNDLCKLTDDYFKGISNENIYYTLLFLLGVNVDNNKIISLIKSSDNYWLKALVINHNLMNDKYIREKIYGYIENRINQSCMGKIFVRGNFQTILNDPFAFCEWMVGKEPIGLLKKGEFYSNYWNKKGVNLVDSMRSPLTFLSEHYLCNLKNTDEMNYWYQYIQSGFICNVHGEHTMRWAGSDADGDIIATTDNKTMINGVYKQELSVTYEVPKGEKKIFTDEDLIKSDLFGFGSIIGQLTNKVTTIRCMMNDYDKDSVEYEILMNRMKYGCKAQSAQIDKTKIGREVKGIPTCWTKWQRIDENDTEEVKNHKSLMNRLLCDKYPYFFIYLYDQTGKDYKKYLESYNISCQTKFGMEMKNLIDFEPKTQEQVEFLDKFKHFSPIIDNDCVMNMVCHHMEETKSKIKFDKRRANNSCYNLMLSECTFSQTTFNNVDKEIKSFISELNGFRSAARNKFDENLKGELDMLYKSFGDRLANICSNSCELANYVVDIFYNKHKSYNKNLMWKLCGKQICENIIQNTNDDVQVPIQDDNGDIEYMGKKYKVINVPIASIKGKVYTDIEEEEYDYNYKREDLC